MNKSIPECADIIKWDVIAQVCPAAWHSLVVLAKQYTSSMKCDGKPGVWLGEIAQAMEMDEWEDSSLAGPIIEAVNILCDEFTDKAKLGLQLKWNNSNEGEDNDDLPPNHGYFEVVNWMVLSPAAVALMNSFTLPVKHAKWTHYDG